MSTTDHTKPKLVDLDMPKGAYGDLSIIGTMPVTQVQSNYASLANLEILNFLGGVVNFVDGKFNASTSATVNSLASMVTSRTLTYKYGVGAFCRFSAYFPSAGVVGARMLAGFFSYTEQLTIGYQDDEFGIMYGHGGLQEIQELQITTSASGAETATVTIDGTGYPVSLTNDTVQVNAEEISAALDGVVPLTEITSVDDMVIISFSVAEPVLGSFSFSSTGTAAGTFTQVEGGVTLIRDFTKQSDWNVRTLNSLDHSKRNYYQIRFNGSLEFYVGEQSSGDPQLVHKINIVNNSTVPPFTNATFRLGMALRNLTSATVLSVQSDGFGMFREVENSVTNPSRSQVNSITSLSSSSSFTNLITIRSRQVYGNKRNLSEVFPKKVSVSHDGNKSLIVEVLKNADLTDNSGFIYEDKGNSVIVYNTNETIVTNGGIIDTIIIPPSLGGVIDLEKLNQVMGERDQISLVVSHPSGAAADVEGSITWSEDV